MSDRRHDFEAKLYILSHEEGGRINPVGQGYRADFRYLDDPLGQAWMIHPRCLIDEAGNALPDDAFVTGDTFARMYILVPEYRVSEHRKRITVGMPFQVVEGSHVVAEGIVTKLVGLLDD